MFEEQNPGPRVVLMDDRMPGVNGIQAMKRMMGMDSEVKVVFISADEGVREEAIREGAVAFVHKPATMKKIIYTIEENQHRKISNTDGVLTFFGKQ